MPREDSTSLAALLSAPSELTDPGSSKTAIVLMTRIRLARNVVGHSFPGWAKGAQREQILTTCRDAVARLPQMKRCFNFAVSDLGELERQILVERHLISREHAAKGVGSGLVLNSEESFCVMINEEDHLRMQALRPGLQLKQAWLALDGLDTALQERVEFAFSDQYGFLTACPTNLGTGIRVSAMLHLPGLVLAEQINQIIQAVNKLGLAVRGLYGEGTEALGNIFQVSNQQTLGESESEIVERLNKVLLQIIEHEENARLSQIEKKPKVLLNHVGRAYGILANAHSISSKETMNLLSLLRLGGDLGLFTDLPKALVDELFLLSQPAHLQLRVTDKLDAEQRDALRADMLRERLRTVQPPDASKLGAKAE
jgi:protein arginine kinase